MATMLFVQCLTDLSIRAILFINSGYTEIEERIVGTIKPVRFLKRLNEYSYKSNNGNKQVLENTYKSDKGNEQGLEEIFNSLFYKYIDTLATNEVTYFVERLWKRFSQEMLPDFKSMYCSEGTFRMILGDLLERNVIYQSDIDNSKLLSYLDSDFHNIIFIQENGRIFVRTIDNIARDLSKRVIFPSLGNDDL